ncbi:hypothetical protein FF1_046071 [Malus domestica]
MDESGESLEDVAHASTSLVGLLVYTYVVKVGQVQALVYQQSKLKRLLHTTNNPKSYTDSSYSAVTEAESRGLRKDDANGHGIGKTLQENAISNGQVFEIEGTTKPHSGGAAHDPVRINLTRRRLTLSIGSGRNWNSEIKVWSFKGISSAVWEERERVRLEQDKGEAEPGFWGGGSGCFDGLGLEDGGVWMHLRDLKGVSWRGGRKMVFSLLSLTDE